MRSTWRFVLFVAASAFILSGCGPEKTVQWSPDGAQAAIVSGGKLYLSDDRGNISNPILDEVERIAWFPDSRRIAAVVKRELDSWEELVRTAPAGFDEKKIVAAVTAAREQLFAYEGDLDDFKPSNSRDLTMQQWLLGFFHVARQADPRLKERLGDDWKELEKARIELRAVQVLQASRDGAGRAVTLFSTISEIDELLVAPDGRALACVARRTEGWSEGDVRSLLVLSTTAGGKEPVLVAEPVAKFPDWSRNARELVFARNAPDSDGLGRISARTVRDDKGEILASPPDPKNLAIAVFSETLKVRCLRDGRVLFSAGEMHLPAPAGKQGQKTTLFFWCPDEKVVRALPQAADAGLPNLVDHFELSPDERRVAIPGSKGQVSVISLATGEITPVIEGSHGDLGTVPVWRSADELCLVAPAGSPHASPKRGEVVLWSKRGIAAISRTWPDEAIK